MKLLNYFLAVNLLFVPNLSFANTNEFLCSKNGYTVVTINGVFTDDVGAKANKKALEFKLDKEYNGEKLKVDYLPNPSHVGGFGDIAVSVYQKIFDQEKVEDYDLMEMLKIASEQVRTQKLLLVAHSQGNFYANSFYDVVADKVGGVPKESLGVYGVATPAGRVAGDGKWLTSDTDKVIVDWVALTPFKKIMPPNTHIELVNEDSWSGHSFSDIYLKYRGGKIVSDIQDALNKLSENNAQDEEKLCIDPPKLTLTHKATGLVLTATDSIINTSGAIIAETAASGVAVVYETNKFIIQVGEQVSLAIASTGNFLAQFLRKQTDASGLALVAEIPLENKTGSSDQGGVSNIANQTNRTDTTNFNLVDTQDEDADPANARQSLTNDKQPAALNPAAAIAQTASVSISAGQGEKTFPVCRYETAQTSNRQKLLINEVAWMGGTVSANDEWLELKNISGSELDVSGWQILDKDEQVKITFPNGKKLGTGGLLLLERTNDDSVPGVTADLVYAGALSNTDEGLRLFDNNCVLVDEVTASPDWSAGDSPTRKTMERGADLSWHTYSGAGNGIFGTPKKENSLPAVSQSGNAPDNQSQNSAPQGPVKILISEVQITGGTGQSDNEFIELFNPNNSAIDLSVLPLKLHIRNSNGTDSHKTLTFINNTISPKGYFLIGPASGYTGTVTLDATYSASSGNKLVNNGGVYISKSATADTEVLDKFGWGDQPAGGYEVAAFPENPIANQSISRKSETDTDNNNNDFIKSKPTPKNSVTNGGFLNPDAWIVLEQLINHIVISEIYPDRTGANQDFVELYNPNAATAGDQDISGWSLQVLSASATTTDKISKKNFIAGNKISGRGFFLIGIDSYPAADMNWASGSLNSTDGATIFLVSGTTTISDITDSRIVDRVAYGNGSATDFSEAVPATMPVAGQSLERKAFQSDLCLAAQAGGEFLGNGCDTDDNSADFEPRTVPNPQTTQKFPEPRTAPSLPRNFSAVYASSSAKMFLSWDDSKDYKDATSTLSYSLSYATSTSSGQATSTAALKNLATVFATTTYSFKSYDVGADYSFSILVKDSEGLSSSAATASLSVASPLTNLYFYKDTRSTTSKKYLFDLYYDKYPFIPDVYNKGTGRILVFYLNKEAPNEIELNTANNFYPQNPDGTAKNAVLGVVYPRCAGDSPTSVGSPGFSLILPGSCGNGGGIENSTLTSGSLEDLHLLLGLAKTADEVTFTDQDFVTVGMYSFADSGGGSQRYRLAVLDRNKYFFRSQTPNHNLPVLGGALAVNFNKSTSKLEIEWPKAIDSDTLDILLTYEISYDGGVSWQSAGTQNKAQKVVVPGDSFSILVRAKDDFSNYSDSPLAASWSYPETDFSIMQTQANSWSLSFGTKNPNCPSCEGTASFQSIQPADNFQFNVLVLRLWKEFGDGADMQISAYSDLNNSPNFNSLIASSSIKGVIDPDKNSDIAFSFGAPITFAGGNKYWLVLGANYRGSDAGFFRSQWHNAINTGVDLYSSGQAGSGNAGICTSSYCSTVYIPYPNATADWYMKIGLTH